MYRQPHDPRTPNQTIAAAVRSRALWPGIAALLLCYFGFFYYSGGVTTGGWVLFYTLRLGGVAMAVSTLLLLTGWKTALAIDGIASMLIGGGLFASGMLMISGDTTQGLLNLVFGYMFASSGWSSYSDWRWIAGSIPTNPGADNRYDPGFQSRYDQTRTQPPGDSLASQLLDRSRNPQPQDDPEPSPYDHPPRDDAFNLADAADQPDQESPFELEEADDPSRPPDPHNTPDGFLASFADPNPDNDKS